MATKLSIDDAIKINKQRDEKLFSHYNPFTGVGYKIKRKAITYDGQQIYLPESAFSEPIIDRLSRLKSVKSLAQRYEIKEDSALKAIFEARFKHDFEFWAVSCVKIQDKVTKQMIPFRLRPAQGKLLATMEGMRLAGKPIRVILLKARQWGGSTLVQIYMAWMQIFHRKNWHSAIVADVENQARNIRSMFTKLAKEYPSEVGTLTLRPFEGSSNIREIIERGNILGIGSAQNPNSLRSYDYAMLHMSEVGLWKETPMKSADDLVQVLRGTVGYFPDTMIVMESTAKGVGNLFHKEWQKAVKKESRYHPEFVAWWEIEIYREPIKDYRKFLDGWTDYHWFLWDIGATLEGINWYFNFMKGENYDHWRMMEEYPSSAEEAFQTTGRRYFPEIYVREARRTVREPDYIGDLQADAMQGKDSLKNIHFVPNPRGNLRIWMHPDDYVTSHPVAHRAACFVDIGGTTDKSDYSVIKVVDRWPMLEGGTAECAAEWRGHIDPALLAWKSAQIATYFYDALLAVEVNALYSRGNNSDGIHYLTIFNEIGNHYKNLFLRNNQAKIKDKPAQYGYHMTEASKGVILSSLKKAWRQGSGGYIEHSEVTVNEAAYFEIKENGTLGAIAGEHDDSLIATAGAKWLATDYMPAPFYIERSKIKRKRAQMADF